MSEHVDTDQLSAYLDGEVAPAERARLEAHLGSCGRCAAQRSALAGVIRSVATLPPVPPTPAETRALRQAVLRGVPRWWRAAWWQRWSWQVFAGAGAAVVLLVGLLGYAALRPASRSTTTAAGAPAPAPATAAPQAVAPASLGSDPEAQAFALTQPGVVQGLQSLTAPQSATATRQFLLGLGGGAGPATTAPVAAGAAVTPLGPAPVTAAGAPSGGTAAVSPPPPGSLLSCVQAVLAALPAGSVPLAATEVTYQGSPAWLLVFAEANPATGGPSLNLAQVVVAARPACVTLDSSTFTR